MLSNNNKSFKLKFFHILLFIAGLSLLIFFFKDSRPVVFIQGEMQSFIASNKISIYSFWRNNKTDSFTELKSEIERLNQKLVDYELIRKDNEALRSQFEISGDATQTLANAKILGFTGDNNSPQTLIISLGEKDGIKKEMSVVSHKSFIGKIKSVSQKFSVVETVLNPDFQTLVKIPETNASGIIKGSRDFMLLDRVVITETIKKGSEVITRGEVGESGVGVFPDLILGKITSMSKNETSPFQSAQVTPIIDLSRITNVFVIVSL